MAAHDTRRESLDSSDELEPFRQAYKDIQSMKRELEHSIATSSQANGDLKLSRQQVESTQTIFQKLEHFFNQYTPAEAADEVSGATSTEAMQQALAIPELLERILWYASERDILTAQRVNRMFRDLIDTSVKLRRKLYLHPGVSPTFTFNPALQCISNN